MTRKVAIIGLGPGKEEAPRDWELWGLGWSKDYGLDRYFEIHKDWRRMGPYSDEAHLVLNDCDAPVYMLEEQYDVPKSVAYPLDAVEQEMGLYLESTVAYALALAILERVPVVRLWGVSGDDGYESQRPNLEYLIGYGRGLGLDMDIGGDSRLLSSEFEQGLYGLADA